MRTLTLIIALFCFQSAVAQDSITLTCDKFLAGIAQFHPLAGRADLETNEADALLLRAKGNFDPLIYGNTQWKQLNDQNYYRQWNSGVKVNLWPGLQLEGGYELNQGLYVNPETKTPADGVVFLGGNLPVLQGLLMDDRRAQLQQARIEQLKANASRNLNINDLLLEGAIAYWEWWLYFKQTEILNQTLYLSYQRWQDTKSTFVLGDRAAVDTLEAYIQFQNRKVDVLKTELSKIQREYLLSNFLWDASGQPLYLQDSIYPQNIDNESINSIIIPLGIQVNRDDSSSIQHPILNILEAEYRQQSIELRLKKEYLKPKLNLKYNWLSNPGNESSELSLRNYRWGVSMEMPLLLRKQRAEVQLAKIKLQDIEFKQTAKTQELRNKQNSEQAAMLQLEQNIRMYRDMKENYFRLLEAEKEKFYLGESSVFLINARENSYLQASLNLLYFEAEFYKTYYKYLWAKGEIQ